MDPGEESRSKYYIKHDKYEHWKKFTKNVSEDDKVQMILFFFFYIAVHSLLALALLAFVALVSKFSYNYGL